MLGPNGQRTKAVSRLRLPEWLMWPKQYMFTIRQNLPPLPFQPYPMGSEIRNSREGHHGHNNNAFRWSPTTERKEEIIKFYTFSLCVHIGPALYGLIPWNRVSAFYKIGRGLHCHQINHVFFLSPPPPSPPAIDVEDFMNTTIMHSVHP